MKRIILASMLLTILFAVTVSAQETPKTAPANGAAPSPAITITPETSPLDLARAAFAAHGGEKFRSVQNMILRGSAQLYAPNSVQSLPGSFALVTTADKMRLDIDARPAFVFKQIYDGENTYSSMPNVTMPPLSKFGLGALARFDKPGYQISAIPDKKKQRGFRIVDPDGYTTDFYVDPKTGRVMSFLLNWQGATLGTEHSKFQQVEGVLVPVSFSQRFELPQGAFFAEFSVKEVKLNQQLPEDAFAIPK